VSAGETTTTTTTVTTNAAPRVYEVVGDDNIVLVAGGLKHVSFNASVSDGDGCVDISSYDLIFWDNMSTTIGNDTNNHNLYENTSCSIECSGNDGTVMCGLNLEYYTNASDQWNANITVSDGEDTSSNVTHELTVLSLAAINVTSTIDFSTVAGGSTLDLGYSPDDDEEVEHEVQNVGNVLEDVLVSGTDLSCTVAGAIPVGNIKYDANANTAYASMCGTLTTNSGDSCSELSDDFDLQKTDGAVSSEKSVYWKIEIPTSGVGGTCTGTLTIGGQAS